MKTLLIAAILTLTAGVAQAAEAEGWRDLEKIHAQIQAMIKEMDRANAAKYFDTKGHATNVDHLLREADKEMGLAVGEVKKAEQSKK